MTSSSLFETYRYSDMVVNPSDAATRPIVTAPSPPSSAMATAARAMASWVSSRRGPRLGASSRPQAMTRARGIGVGEAVTIASVALTVYIADCVRHTQRMTYTVISIDGLVARYGDLVVLDHLTLDVGPGVLALLGPNGAGKTTLVDTVTTLRRPDAGRVRVHGHDVVADAPAVRGLLGVTGQQASVDVVLTGRENLVLTGRLLGLGRAGSRRRADELLERFDLTEPADRRVATWSGGMRRRLDLAASLVTTPRVLVLDEPTTGLDARSRGALWEEVRGIAAAGTTVLLTTQYLEEADVLADRVVVLDGGRVVADGTPDALRRAVGGEVVQVHDSAGAVTDVLLDRRVGSRRRAGAGPGGSRGAGHRPAPEHGRGVPPPHRRRHGGVVAPSRCRPPGRGGVGMSDVISAGTVFIGRSLRHSARDVESLVMSVTLPVMLMLLFTYVFGAPRRGPGLVCRVRRPGDRPALRRVRCRDDRSRRGQRPRWWDGRPAASDAGPCLDPARRPRRRQPGAQPRGHGHRAGGGCAARVPPDRRTAGWIGAIGVIAAWVLAVTAVFALIGLLSGSPKRRTATGSSCCSCPMSPVRSCPSTRCPPGCAGSPSTSRSRR